MGKGIVMKPYRVILNYVDPEGVEHPLWEGVIEARSKADARRLSIVEHWEPRLDTTGCSPCVTVMPVRCLDCGAEWAEELKLVGVHGPEED